METLRKKAADRLLWGVGWWGVGPESFILIVPGPLTHWVMDPSAEPKLVQLISRVPTPSPAPPRDLQIREPGLLDTKGLANRGLGRIHD